MSYNKPTLVVIWAFLIAIVPTTVVEAPPVDETVPKQYKRSVEKANLYYEPALNALKKNKRENAKELLRKTLGADPIHPEAVLKLGELLLEESASIHEIATLYKNWLQAMKAIGAGDSACKETEREVSAKLSDISKIVEIDKKYSKRLTELGESLEQKKRINRAAAAFQKAFELDPNNQTAREGYAKLVGKVPDKAPVVKREEKLPFEKATLLESYDFSATPQNWNLSKDNGVWIEDGKFLLKMVTEHSSSPYELFNVTSVAAIDFCFTAVVDTRSSKGDEAGGIYFRHHTKDDRLFCFMISPQRKFGVWFCRRKPLLEVRDITGKGENELTPSVPSSYIVKGKNILSVGCIGEDIYCFINSHLVAKCRSYVIPAGGRLGFIINNGFHTFAFDDAELHTIAASVTDKSVDVPAPSVRKPIQGIPFVKEKLLINSNFDTPNSGWDLQKERSWTENGEYLLRAEQNNLYCPFHPRDVRTENFYYEATITSRSGNSSNAGGLAFRAQLDTLTYYIFLISADSQFGLWAYMNNGKIIKDLISKKTTRQLQPHTISRHIKKEEKNLLSVVCIKRTIYCFINSHLVFQTTDSSIIRNGKIGFMLNKGNHIFSFDDVRVYSVVPAEAAPPVDEDDKEIADLRQKLESDNPKERRQAVKRLGRIGGSTAIGLLIETLADEDSSVRTEAVKALQKLHPAEAAEPLVEVLASPKELASIRRYAEKAMIAIGAPAVDPLIDAAITNNDLRKRVTGMLAKIGGDAVESLIVLLDSEERDVVRWATKSLVKIGKSAVMPLVNMINSSYNNPVRLEAIWALGEIGDKRALKPLTKLYFISEKEDATIREAARKAAEKIRH